MCREDSLSILMASVMCLHLSTQAEDILEDTIHRNKNLLVGGRNYVVLTFMLTPYI